MRILITHLTRMSHPNICVAGLTREGQHIRPIPIETTLARSHLNQCGGIFDVGAVIELDDVEDVGLPPEFEDRLFSLAAATFQLRLKADDFWRFQLKTSKTNLVTIFGTDLARIGSSLIVPLGKGIASLGCLRPNTRPKLFVDKRGKVRMRMLHEGATLFLPVTDVRLYKDDHQSVNEQRLEWLNRTISFNDLLGVGLGRPFKAETRPAEETGYR